jgi:CHAD domain-containing protein
MDALHATGRGDFWYEQFQQELVFLPVAAGDRKIATAGEKPADDATLPAVTSAAAAETPNGATPLTPPAPPLPEAQPLLSDEPMSEAGRKVIHFHFGRMLYHEPGTRLGEDPEALHDMRVATRRMRAAFQLFAPYYEAKTIKPPGKALRRTGRTLGAVRDLDVLLGKAHAHAAGLPAEQADGLAPLLADWQARREVARRQMLDYLDSDDYREFVSGFERFLTTPGAGAVAIPAGEPTPHQVCHIVPQIILARFEQVRAFEPIVGSSAPGSADGAPVEMLHRLRIECKGLRYAMEFFRELLGPEAAGLIKQVVGMQDLLGELQDACVAESLIAEFLAQQRRKRRKQQEARLDGVEAYLAAQQAIQAAQIARFPEPWAALLGADFRRALMLALAAM